MLRRGVARQMEGGIRENVESSVRPTMRKNITVSFGIEGDSIRTVVRDGQIAGVSDIGRDDLSGSKQLVLRGGVELCEHDASDDRHDRDDNQQLDQREAVAISSLISLAIQRAAAEPALGAAS